MTDAPIQVVLRRLRVAEVAGELGAATDAQLVERFANSSDEAAFALLLRRHGPMVLGLGRRLLGQEQDAEDVLQAAFLLLARKAGTIRKKESVASWLHGIVYRLARKVRTQRASKRAREKEAAAMRDTKPRAGAAWRDLHELLHEVMEKLPERYRGALVLFHLEGRTHEEAARQIGCPLATFRSRLTRGRKLLQKELARRGVAPSAAAFTAILTAASNAATVPVPMTSQVLQSALQFAAGESANRVASPSVVSLLEGAMRAMTVKKVILFVGLVLTLATFGVSAMVLANHGSGDSAKKVALAFPPKIQVVGEPKATQDRQGQTGVPANGKPKPPNLMTLVLQSDQIVVGSSFLADPKETAKELRFLEVTTLKGPKMALQIRPVKEMKPLPDTNPGKQWIFFLKSRDHGVAWPQLSPAAPTGWFMPYTPEMAEKIKKAIPPPNEWGKEVEGLSLGLRLRKPTFKLGEDIIADIYLENVSQKNIEVIQHRYNIYDYWPRTSFEVKAPDGKKWFLEKPEGPMREDDAPYKRVLKPGEKYIHAVYLNRWPVTNDQKEKKADNLFVEPGVYNVTCRYEHFAGGGNNKILTSAPVTLNVPKQGLGQARLKAVLERLDRFHLAFTLHPDNTLIGGKPKGKWDRRFPLRHLSLRVPKLWPSPPLMGPEGKPISADVLIPKEQARKLTMVVAQDGFFDRAFTPLFVPPARPVPFLIISVTPDGTDPPTEFHLPYPWNKTTLRLLQDLRDSVEGEARKLMSQMLAPIEKDLNPLPG